MEWTNTERVLEEFGAYFRNLLQDRIIEEDMIASGELLNDLDYVIDAGENQWTVSVKIKDYFRYIDEGTEGPYKGTKGGTTLRDAIKKWVSVKPVLPEVDSNGKLPTVDQLVFLISRKIARDGIEGREIWEPTVKEAVDMYEQKLGDAILDDLGEDIERVLMEIY